MRLKPRDTLFVLALLGVVPPAAPQDAVFRSIVDLVTVDATVLGRDGRPRTDLTRDDFVLKVDGQPRRIVSSQFISRPPASERSPVLAAQHFSSNEANDAGRFIVVAVDDEHIRQAEGRAALSAAARFIDTLDRLDLVAVTPLSRVGVVDFTRDRVDLKRRLQGLAGRADPLFLQFNIGLLEAVEIADGVRARLADAVLRECGRSLTEYLSQARAIDNAAGRDACAEQLEQEARAVAQHARTQASISLAGLEALVASLKTLPGNKTVVLLSEGMVLDPRLIDLTAFAAMAKEARVSVYALHMEVPMFEASQDRVSPSAQRDRQLRGDSLERLAGSARGAVFHLVGSDPRPFERIATEISGYYLLAFEAVDADRDGQLHKIDVSVTKSAGELRSRTAFRMPAVKPSPRAVEDDLVRLLRGAQSATELPVRVATFTYAEPGTSRLRIVVSGETDAPREVPAAADPSAAQASPSEVLLGYVLTNTAGVIVASGAQRAPDGRHAFSTVLVPGPYTLRVAGIDLLGREGLVERPFLASLGASGDVRVSDLMVAPEPTSEMAPLQPFVDDVIGARLVAYMELYAESAMLGDARVAFGIAPEGSETEIRTVPAAVRAREEPFAVARAVLSLDGLQRGRYIVIARVALAGEPERRVTRPFTYRGTKN